MRKIEFPVAISVVAVATSVGALVACRSEAKQGGAPVPSASVAIVGSPDAGLAARPFVDAGLAARPVVDAGPLASGIPVPASRVEEAVNGRHLAPYAGPTGTVEGTVRVSGDKAPVANLQIPAECGEAMATYGKLFREGSDRALADVLVAVTEYDGYVPAKGDVQPVSIHGCAFERRTYALTYGQRLEVSNRDAKGNYLPTLVGANMPAQMVALPHGDAVRLYPTSPGLYELTDDMNRAYMKASVYVVKYATVDVTDLTGHYRITGIPTGKVKVSVLSPAIERHDEREVEVKPDAATRADFVLPYKLEKQPAKPASTKPADEPAVIR
jgi:hypothetical protein